MLLVMAATITLFAICSHTSTLAQHWIDERSKPRSTEKFTDFRERSYTAEDLAEALFPARTKRGLPSKLSETVGVTLSISFASNSARIFPRDYADLNKLGEYVITGSETPSRPLIQHFSADVPAGL